MRQSRFRWIELILGTAMVLLGIWTLFNPGKMLSGMIRLYAVFAIASGIRDILFYCRTTVNIGFRPMLSLTAGITGIVAGVMLLAYPNAGKWIVALLIPIWFLSHSIFQLASLRTLRMMVESRYYWISLIASILGLVLGILMLINPVTVVITVEILVGLYLILTGCNSILLAFRFRN